MNKKTKVDVLEVLEKCASYMFRKGFSDCPAELNAAANAVAELITAITILSDYCDNNRMDPNSEKYCAALSEHWRRVELAIAATGATE